MNDLDHCTCPTLWWCPLTHDYACKECNKGFKVTPVKTDKEIIADLQKKIDELEKLVEKKYAEPHDWTRHLDRAHITYTLGAGSVQTPFDPSN